MQFPSLQSPVINKCRITGSTEYEIALKTNSAPINNFKTT